MKTGEHGLDALQREARERSAQLDIDTRIKLALDLGLRNGQDIGELRAEHRQLRVDIGELKGDVKGILRELGVLSAIKPFDRWLQRIALAAVSAAGIGVVVWLVYQAWKGSL